MSLSSAHNSDGVLFPQVVIAGNHDLTFDVECV